MAKRKEHPVQGPVERLMDFADKSLPAQPVGKGFSHNNLLSLREVTKENLANLRTEMMEARASRAETIANLEAWRDELNEIIAILRAQHG
jgi:hypothetical protein